MAYRVTVKWTKFDLVKRTKKCSCKIGDIFGQSQKTADMQFLVQMENGRILVRAM